MIATKDIKRVLLDDVLTNPNDDLPRLAYADYLQEYGGEGERAYGEFIQLQIQIHRRDPYYCMDDEVNWKVYDESIHTDVARAAVALRWAMHYDTVPTNTIGTALSLYRTFRRGFICSLRGDLHRLFKYGVGLVLDQPGMKIEAVCSGPQMSLDRKDPYFWQFEVCDDPTEIISAGPHVLPAQLMPACKGERKQYADRAYYSSSGWAKFDLSNMLVWYLKEGYKQRKVGKQP